MPPPAWLSKEKVRVCVLRALLYTTIQWLACRLLNREGEEGRRRGADDNDAGWSIDDED